jgi:hypothetical protein
MYLPARIEIKNLGKKYKSYEIPLLGSVMKGRGTLLQGEAYFSVFLYNKWSKLHFFRQIPMPQKKRKTEKISTGGAQLSI